MEVGASIFMMLSQGPANARSLRKTIITGEVKSHASHGIFPLCTALQHVLLTVNRAGRTIKNEGSYFSYWEDSAMTNEELVVSTIEQHGRLSGPEVLHRGNFPPGTPLAEVTTTITRKCTEGILARVTPVNETPMFSRVV